MYLVEVGPCQVEVGLSVRECELLVEVLELGLRELVERARAGDRAFVETVITVLKVAGMAAGTLEG